MRKLFLFCFSAVFLCCILNAEDQKPVDKEKRANIVKLMELQGMMGYAPDTKGSNPLLKDLRKEQMDKTHELMIFAYDKYLSDADVRDLIALFDGPAWKKFKRVQPLITKEIMTASKALAAAMLPGSV